MVYHEAIELLLDILGGGQADLMPGTSLDNLTPLDRAKWVIACEERWHLLIHDEDILGFNTLKDMTDYMDLIIADGTYRKPVTERDREEWYYESSAKQNRY